GACGPRARVPRPCPWGCATWCCPRSRPNLRRARTKSPLRAKQPCRAGCGRGATDPRAAPDSSGAWRRAICRCSSPWRSPCGRGADLDVEIVDQAVPPRYAVHETAPEPLVSSLFEIVEAHALLLHPGEVPEVENPLAVEMGQLEDVIILDAFQVAAEDFPGIDLVEPVAVAPRQKAAPLAGVKERAVGRHRHHHVVGAEIKMLGDLYGGDDIRQPRDADVV